MGPPPRRGRKPGGDAKNSSQALLSRSCRAGLGPHSASPIPPHSPTECPHQEMDIVFLIDGSGSINQNDFNRMKGFVQAVMDQFEGTDTLVKTGHLGLGVGGRGRLARERHPGRGWGRLVESYAMGLEWRMKLWSQRRPNLSPDLGGATFWHLICIQKLQEIQCFCCLKTLKVFKK